MCGICGMVSSGRPVKAEVVERMCEAIVHRGPDDGGVYLSPDAQCALGNRRLSILDMSFAGHMPMSTEDGRFHITYNGEVYNFADLRGELESRGYRFRSGTDTEVILALYREHGEACVDRLNGMFAFAIWDEMERTLFLARDRMGIKPLYFARQGSSLLFASEIRAILASGLVSRRIDPVGATGYLMLGSVPDECTIVAGVQSFPPAHVARWRNGQLSFHRYWNHRDELLNAEPLPEDEIAEGLRETLKDAVRRQLISDAPIGIFLSGGLDSSMLAALSCALGREHMRSVSITFEERAYDESSAASAVAGRFGLDHVESRVTAETVAAELDRVIAGMDQPSSDAINTYFASKAAREADLTVALSGLGADELFGGYPSFQTVPEVRRLMSRIRKIPGYASLLPLAEWSPGVPLRGRKLARWMNGSDSIEAAYVTVRGILAPGEARKLTPKMVDFRAAEYVRATVDVRGLGEQEAVSLMESRLYMHNQLLRDTDAMSMRHSLEVRVPFLDNAVVSMAARCKAALGRSRKASLIAARAIYFPSGLESGGKKGFSFPFEEWLAGGKHAELLEVSDSRGPIDARAAGVLLREYARGRRHWASPWTANVLQRWLSTHEVSV